MTTRYQIQELIERSETRTIHQVQGDDGRSLWLTRVLLEEDERESLKRSPALWEALDALRSLRHPSLCEVIDCGVDDEGIPWVMSGWQDGESVDEVKIEEAELRKVTEGAKGLLNDLGPVTGAVNFELGEIYFQGEDRERCVFRVDYVRWFSDIAGGAGPGANRDGEEEVSQLLRQLSMRQLQPAQKKEKLTPIPFVDDRSPALRTLAPVAEPWLVRLLTCLVVVACVAVIAWLTVEGMRRIEENPRKEQAL